MSSRLEGIRDWEELAAAAGYDPQQLARERRVSVRTLERFFRDHFHLTPEAWMRELRMRKAADLLSHGEAVKVISQSLKYKDPANFSTIFTRHYGISPSRFQAARQ